MEGWLEFGRGPIFRFALCVMALGLARIVVVSVWDIVVATQRARDRNIQYWAIAKQTASWMLPITKLHRYQPGMSLVSFLFHLGLILVALLLGDHIELWREGIGFGWPAIPRIVADGLTLVTIVTGIIMIGARIGTPRMRSMSKTMDYLLLVLLVVIFTSGFLASRPLAPFSYSSMMLIHVMCGNAILILTPFTKLSHCVLFPLVRLSTEVAWKFAPGAGERVVLTVRGEVKPL